MEDNPEAASQGTEAVPQTAQTEPTGDAPQAPGINAEQVAKYLGTDAETLSKFQKFVEANGKFDSAFSKMKTDISNPAPAPQPTQSQPVESAQQLQPQSVKQPQYKAPEGSISAQEFLAQQYFQSLSKDPKYEAISEQIANGDVLKEMANFNIQPLNQDGSLNDQMVRRYLDLKAQTVPAKTNSSEPSASPAPTVEYIPVGEDGKVMSSDQAYAILQQDAQLKAMGQPGHPAIQSAEEFIKNQLNPGAAKK